MSELQFPKNPIVGQEYDFAPYKYYWDGVKWKTKGTGCLQVNSAYVAGALTPTGYMNIKDETGTVRRMLIG